MTTNSDIALNLHTDIRELEAEIIRVETGKRALYAKTTGIEPLHCALPGQQYSRFVEPNPSSGLEVLGSSSLFDIDTPRQSAGCV